MFTVAYSLGAASLLGSEGACIALTLAELLLEVQASHLGH